MFIIIVVCPQEVVHGFALKRALLLKIKTQLSSIWAKGCILMTVCVFNLT